MKVVLFGATGMVGKGALLQCIRDPGVTAILAVGRGPCGVEDPKVRNLIHKDFLDFSPVKAELTGYDACFYCVGVTSTGMSEADYRRVTRDFTVAAAKVLVEANSRMTFVFVSGSGADSTEKGRVMWARVKGATENDLFKLPFKGVYVLRPSLIQPLDGVRSKTKLYDVFYGVSKPLFPVLNALFPKAVTTTRRIGDAMLELARAGSDRKIFENRDINALVT